MIISSLTGGMGNQMFQFSLGIALADHWNTSLYLDIIDTGAHSGRDKFILNEAFLLPKYGLLDNVDIHYWNLGLLKYQSIRKHLLGPLGKLLAWHKDLDTEHSVKPSNIDFLFRKKPKYIAGYWQNAAFALAHRELIKRCFTFRDSVIEKANLNNRTVCKDFSRVAVHIRRGDFVTSQSGRDIHGACSARYYLAAIEYVKNAVNRPIFLFFSDDVIWVRNTLLPLIGKINYAIISDATIPQYIDMYNMSICEHHILSNSTFSWWGWWLSSSLEKNGVVIAPEPWNVSTKFDYSAILDPSFILISR